MRPQNDYPFRVTLSIACQIHFSVSFCRDSACQGGTTCYEDKRTVTVLYECSGGSCPPSYCGPQYVWMPYEITLACLCKNVGY